MMVERSVQVFTPFDGQYVTLEGQLRGNILDSARLMPDETLRQGTYRGRLESGLYTGGYTGDGPSQLIVFKAN